MGRSVPSSPIGTVADQTLNFEDRERLCISKMKLLLDLVNISIIIDFLVAYMNWNIENKIGRDCVTL
jgi:hypothetical protein